MRLISSDLLVWISMPFSSDHPLLRTPEPQFTYALAAISPYLALPFAYPFVGLAGLCACTAFPLRTKRFAIVLGVLATLLVATIAAKLLLNPILAGYAAFSHAPLFSCSAALAFLLLWPNREKFGHDEFFILKGLVVGLVVAQNQQIISGFLIQPSNIEQYFGVPLCAYLCARVLELYLPNFKTAVLLAASTIFALQLLEIMQRNHNLLLTATLSPTIIEQATQDPRALIEFDIHTATRLNLVAAKQAPTLLSITAGYSLLADRYIQQYRYAKSKLMPIENPILQSTLRTLDAVYSFDNRNAPLNTIGRRSDFGAARDTSALEENSANVQSNAK